MTDLAPVRRKQIRAHCLRFVHECNDSDSAIHAADWYESNDPQVMAGLGQRVRRDIEALRVAKAVKGAK